MKDKNIKLSVEELETLCNLYIDCKLSVLEETELYYVLLMTDIDSTLINETRTIMGIERKLAHTPKPAVGKVPFYKRFVYYGAAAVLFGIILSVFMPSVEDKSVIQPPALAQNHDTDKETSQESRNGIQKHNEAGEMTLSMKPTKTEAFKKTADFNKNEPERELNLHDEYIEITDENEAAVILKNVDTKIAAILEKGINAQNKMNDIDEKINNLLNKI